MTDRNTTDFICRLGCIPLIVLKDLSDIPHFGRTNLMRDNQEYLFSESNSVRTK